MKKRKSTGHKNNVRGTNDNLIERFSAKKIRLVKRAAKTALAVHTGIAGNGGPSDDKFVVDLDEKVDRSSRVEVQSTYGVYSLAK